MNEVAWLISLLMSSLISSVMSSCSFEDYSSLLLAVFEAPNLCGVTELYENVQSLSDEFWVMSSEDEEVEMWLREEGTNSCE